MTDISIHSGQSGPVNTYPVFRIDRVSNLSETDEQRITDILFQSFESSTTAY